MLHGVDTVARFNLGIKYSSLCGKENGCKQKACFQWGIAQRPCKELQQEGACRREAQD